MAGATSPPARGHGRWRAVAAALTAAALTTAALTAVAACAVSTASGPNGSTGPGGKVLVVAAENFWGSIASQIGGSHARVVSIVTNPDTDPHSYEPTAADARLLAAAQFVIENGIGYDPWVARLLAADEGNQVTLDVGAALGIAPGANPHRWYNPADVRAVVGRMVADYQRIDPGDSAYFAARRTRFVAVALRQYDAAIATIRARYSGTPVGASESIFAMLAPALRLRLITPGTFLKAISEGTEVSAADKQAIDNQIRHHLIEIYVYNSQNVTPDVQAQLAEARAENIPVATITETLAPAADSYQAWQIRQLVGIEAALVAATGH